MSYMLVVMQTVGGKPQTVEEKRVAAERMERMPGLRRGTPGAGHPPGR